MRSDLDLLQDAIMALLLQEARYDSKDVINKSLITFLIEHKIIL
jgi:hypothetical protein